MVSFVDDEDEAACMAAYYRASRMDRRGRSGQLKQTARETSNKA